MCEMIVIFAHWCPKCNMMMPLVDEIEKDYEGQMRITRIDSEVYPEMAEKYAIEIVPAFIFRNEEQEIGRMAGLIGEETLRERICEMMKKSACIS